MAYRRLAWMSKGLIPALAYGSLTLIPRNRNDDGTFSAPTGSHLFLPSSSTLLKDQIYSLNLLSVDKNVSKFPQGKEEFLEKIEAQIPTARIKNVDGDNVDEAEKDDKDRLIDLANDIHRQLVEIEEKANEVDKLMGEMIAKLKGFESLLTWNAEDEKLIRERKTTRILNIISDVMIRDSKSYADWLRLYRQIKARESSGEVMQKPLHDAVSSILVDMLRIKIIKRRVKKKVMKLKSMLRRREDLQFCLSITVRR